MRQVAYRPVPSPSYPDSNNNRRGPSPVIALAAIVMFALSGLFIGLAVGALTHRHTSIGKADTQQDTHPISTQTQTSRQTTPAQKVKLGCPIIESYDGTVVASGNISYTFAVQARDQSAGPPPCYLGKPVYAPGITCKLWLTKDDNISGTLIGIIGSRLTKIDTLAQPMPDEIEHGLVFDATTPQTQNCDEKGHAMWKYGIDPSIHTGRYHLVILTDWDGTYYNWSWANIEVKKND